MITKLRFIWGVCLSFLVLASWNLVDLLLPPRCYDCHFHRGRPFAFYQEGGYVADSGFLLWGLLKDLLVIAVLGAIVGVLWTRLRHDRRIVVAGL